MPLLILYDKITAKIKWKNNDSSSLAKQSSKHAFVTSHDLMVGMTRQK